MKKLSGLRQSSILNPFISTKQPLSRHRLEASLLRAGIRPRLRCGLAVEVRPFGPHPLVGIGVDELRWLAPVRPGDKLHLEGEVVELTPSKTKPQGIVRVKWTLFKEHGDPVYTFTSINIVPRRPV